MSHDHATTLQPGEQSKTLPPKKKRKEKKERKKEGRREGEKRKAKSLNQMRWLKPVILEAVWRQREADH